MNLIYFLSIFILLVVVLSVKDKVLVSSKTNTVTYWITLLLTALIIVCCIYLLQTFIVEKFHFEVSPPRKLGMQEHVLPLIPPGEELGYKTQSIDYPVQGSGITCSKIYTGHEGNLNMNIGEWKRGSGNGIPARPDIYLQGNTSKVPFAGNCDSCQVNTGTFDIENKDKACPSPYVENMDKKIVKEGYKPTFDKLSELDIVMYSRDGCPFCDKAMDLFGDQISQITVKKNEGTPEGVNGVPHFESRASGKSHTGCPSSIDELINALKGKVNNKKNNQPDKLSAMDIVMYSRDGCPFCDKAMDLFGDQISQITVKKNEGTPEGVNGVPHFESRASGKSHTGCPSSIDELINALKGNNTLENYEPAPYNSQYFEYKNYIAPYETSVMDTLSCYKGGCPLKNKSGKVGVPFV